MIENKKDTLNKGEGIDWATAEALAFGSLLNEGFRLGYLAKIRKEVLFPRGIPQL